jgi:hypothetical protein
LTLGSKNVEKTQDDSLNDQTGISKANGTSLPAHFDSSTSSLRHNDEPIDSQIKPINENQSSDFPIEKVEAVQQVDSSDISRQDNTDRNEPLDESAFRNQNIEGGNLSYQPSTSRPNNRMVSFYSDAVL